MSSADRDINLNGHAVVINRDGRRGITDTNLLYEVLALVANGFTNRMIARKLCISDSGAKARVHWLLVHLGAADRAHAVSIGYQRGLLAVDLPDSRALRSCVDDTAAGAPNQGGDR